MSVPIRLATLDDADEVARLMIAFRDWTERSEPSDDRFRAGVRRLLDDPNTEYLLGGDPPAGVVQLRYRYGLWYDTDDCLLEDLYVADDARGTGLGRALLEAALGRARERGCARVELDVNEKNEAALALYRSAGFDSWAELFEGNNLFMRCRL
jgi:ribosomal protein S18 acetylase RimI-like enzyme